MYQHSNHAQDHEVNLSRGAAVSSSNPKTSFSMRVLRGWMALCLLAMFISSCTKNSDDTECPDCEEIVTDDILIFMQAEPDPDTTSIVTDDILIF